MSTPSGKLSCVHNSNLIDEVVEVSLFVLWMNLVLAPGLSALSLAAVERNDGGDAAAAAAVPCGRRGAVDAAAAGGDGALVVVPCRSLMRWGVGLALGTLALTYVIGIALGELAPLPAWPMISDLWTFVPNNWISRWTIVQGVSALLWVQLMAQAACCGATTADGGAVAWASRDALALALQTLAVLGLAGVGCVNEDENHALHCLFAYVFFGGYALYMVLAALAPQWRAAAPAAAVTRALALVGAATAVRFVPGAVRDEVTHERQACACHES